MKSYKTTPKLESNLNYVKNQQSDIFCQKGLNKPEIEYGHKKLIPKNTFKSSSNILEWNDNSPHLNPSIKIKQNPNNVSQILNSNMTNYMKYNLNFIPGFSKHKPFYEKMFENVPNDKTNKSGIYLNERYQKETMNLGNYEGKEYKIKKNKSMAYDPSPYLENKHPLKRKMDLIYGGCDDLIGDYKPAINRNKKIERSVSSIGFARRDFQTNNEWDPKILNNPKEMKYFSIYGNKGIENANKKLKPISLERSTNNKYVPGEDPKKNRQNFLRSNIFNDKEIDKKNNDEYNLNDNIDYNNNNEENKTIKVNRKSKNKKISMRTKSANVFKIKNKSNIDNNTDITNNEDLINKDNHSKRSLYRQNDEKLPKKLDWRDPQLYLLFPQNKNEDILKNNARQRKFKEIYGQDPILPKERLCEEFKSDERFEIEEEAKNNYTNVNFSKMKRISENISQMQGNKFLKENSKNYLNVQNHESKNNEEGKTYEIKSTKNKVLISNKELEKHFANNGIHLYDLIEKAGSVFNNKNDNKIEFKIRNNNKGSNLEGKITQIKKELKDKGFILKEKNIKKKEGNDIIPHTLKWDDPHYDLMTKNKNVVKSNQETTHSKRLLNRVDEKITRISVNLKYKNKPYYI